MAPVKTSIKGGRRIVSSKGIATGHRRRSTKAVGTSVVASVGDARARKKPRSSGAQDPAAQSPAPLQDASGGLQPSPHFSGFGEFTAVARVAPSLHGQRSDAAHFEGFVGKRKSKKARVRLVIRDKRTLLLQSSVLIKALEEATHFAPRKGDNWGPPDLWRDLHLDDPANIADIKELIEQLKRLNDILESSARPPKTGPIAAAATQMLLQFATKYGNVVATGAGALTIGTACAIVANLGHSEIVQYAFAWQALSAVRK